MPPSERPEMVISLEKTEIPLQPNLPEAECKAHCLAHRRICITHRRRLPRIRAWTAASYLLMRMTHKGIDNVARHNTWLVLHWVFYTNGGVTCELNLYGLRYTAKMPRKRRGTTWNNADAEDPKKPISACQEQSHVTTPKQYRSQHNTA